MELAADRPVIEFRDVSYRVGGTQVLSGFNLQVMKGETLVLLGRSGSGKTTSLKLVNRLLLPTSGEILVKGVSNAEGDVIRLRRGMGYVIQDVGLFPHFSVERNIGLVPKIEGWSEDRVRARVQELLQMVGLPADIASRYPHQLSGGQRQRVGVARALAADPEILLMDEPFGALDAITRDELQREFLLLQQRLQQDRGVCDARFARSSAAGIADCIDGGGTVGYRSCAGRVPAVDRSTGVGVCQGFW